MCVRENAVRPSINVADSFIARQARQHDVAAGGKFRNALRDGAAILNQLFRLAVVPVVRRQLEAGFKQPPRDRPAHVADADKSKSAVFLRDWFHDKSPNFHAGQMHALYRLREEPGIQARCWQLGRYGVSR